MRKGKDRNRMRGGRERQTEREEEEEEEEEYANKITGFCSNMKYIGKNTFVIPKQLCLLIKYSPIYFYNCRTLNSLRNCKENLPFAFYLLVC